MKRLELTDFTPHIGSAFTVSYHLNGEPTSSDFILSEAVPYELDARDRRKVAPSDEFRSVPFSLFFTGVLDGFLPQGVYTFAHPAFTEALELFINCTGPAEGGKGYIYEAVFG